MAWASMRPPLRRKREEQHPLHNNQCKRVYPLPGRDHPNMMKMMKFHPGKNTIQPRRTMPPKKRIFNQVHKPALSAQPLKAIPKVQSFAQAKNLPKHWLKCPANGQPIDRIIPSKTPVSESFDQFLDPGRRCPVPNAISQAEIGLIIDLTDSLYYDPSDCAKKGVKHVKIACEKKDALPDNESVNNFVFEVLKFTKIEGQTKYILVHCTHGFNVTGYMIVHYLMRSHSITVTEALERFAAARAPGIFKQKYIDALYAFYHDVKPQSYVWPSTPEWKLRPEFDLNAEPVEDDECTDDDEDNKENISAMSASANDVLKDDDVLGDAVSYEQQVNLREVCYRLLNVDTSTKERPLFPGPHPISLTRNNFHLLRNRYFYTTWKAVGTRYMMLITWEGCYLIDRSFCFRRVQMRFPSKQLHTATHNYTLLDGEMVIDTMPDSQIQKRRYLITDVMAINNVSVVELPFHERWKRIEKQVLEPRNIERQNTNLNYIYDMEPFRVRRKDFWPLSTAAKLVKDFIPKLSHPADGLIFQSWDDKYVCHNHGGLLKWQFKHTVKFLFEVDKENRRFLYLFQRGEKTLMENDRVILGDVYDPAELSGKIIECSGGAYNGVWSYICNRPDRNIPDTIQTYFKVTKGIKNQILENVLMNEVSEIVRLPSYVDKSPKQD